MNLKHLGSRGIMPATYFQRKSSEEEDVKANVGKC